MLSRLFLLAALMALLSAVTARPPSDLRPLEIRAEAGAARRNPTNKPVAPREEAIRLYDKMDYKGYNLTYGPLMRCGKFLSLLPCFGVEGYESDMLPSRIS